MKCSRFQFEVETLDAVLDVVVVVVAVVVAVVSSSCQLAASVTCRN